MLFFLIFKFQASTLSIIVPFKLLFPMKLTSSFDNAKKTVYH
jgi:hypothetical protein